MASTFNIDEVRKHFPALNREYQGRHVAYLDGPGGSQVVDMAINAMVAYMSRGGANLHGVFPSSVETDTLLLNAREHVAALLGAQANEIAFGANMTSLNLSISRALSSTWSAGDEVVVTELDHRANVDPWIRAAEDKGVTVKWLEVNPETLALDYDSLDRVITDKTRVVAVGLASNGVGTVTDVARVAKRAHEVGAIVVVDAVHATPHMVIDRDALGADILVCSAYKFFGPHVGIACIRTGLFESLNVYKLKPAPSHIPDKLETGTQNHEGLAGVVGAIEFIASVGSGLSNVSGTGLGQGTGASDLGQASDASFFGQPSGASDLGHGSGASTSSAGSLRERIVSGMRLMEAYEESLGIRVREGLAQLPHVRSYAAPAGIRKTPTIAFTVDGIDSREACQRLLDSHAIFVADGDFYASTLAAKLGVMQHGGWVRAGLAPYNTVEEVDAMIEGVAVLKA